MLSVAAHAMASSEAIVQADPNHVEAIDTRDCSLPDIPAHKFLH